MIRILNPTCHKMKATKSVPLVKWIPNILKTVLQTTLRGKRRTHIENGEMGDLRKLYKGNRKPKLDDLILYKFTHTHKIK